MDVRQRCRIIRAFQARLSVPQMMSNGLLLLLWLPVPGHLLCQDPLQRPLLGDLVPVEVVLGELLHLVPCVVGHHLVVVVVRVVVGDRLHVVRVLEVVVGSLVKVRLVVSGVEQQPRLNTATAFSGVKGGHQARTWTMAEPCVQFCFTDSLRVEVGRDRADVAHVGVVDQGGETHRAAVEEVQDLGPAVRPRNGSCCRLDWDEVSWVDQHCQVCSVEVLVDRQEDVM